MVFGSDFLTKILSVLSFRLGMVLGSDFLRKSFQWSVFSDKRSSVTLDPRLEYSKTPGDCYKKPSSLITEN